MRFLSRRSSDTTFRPATLEDSGILAKIYKDHSMIMQLLDEPKNQDKFRLAIGSSMLNKTNYYVLEETDEIIGFIEHRQRNQSHVIVSYPFVDLDHPRREELQHDMIIDSMKELKKYGYRFVSTRVSLNMDDVANVFNKLGFSDQRIVMQIYEGEFNPDYDLEVNDLTFRRVKVTDLDVTYSWIKRQLNPNSPLYITKENYSRLLHSPKSFRDGWAMAMKDDKPVAMVSSFVDANTGIIMMFGPFNDKKHITARIPLLNEMMIYYYLRGDSYFRLMRTEPFDNDDEIIKKYNLIKREDVRFLTKKL